MQNILLSIIVPVYKTEDYLTKCVESLINGCENFLNNVEILLIDDGSPDRCPQICDELSQKYSVVKTIHKTNAGVSSARNTGIENACGKYVTFCDSDDYVTHDFKKIFNYINKYPNVEVFSVGLVKNNKIISKFNDKILNPQKYGDLLEIVKNDVTISCCAKIVKRALIEKYNLYIPSGIKSEDFAWSINVLLHANSYMLLNLAYYVYVDRETSVTHSITLSGIESQVINYRRVKDVVLTLPFNKRQQKKLLRHLMKGFVYVVYTSKFLTKQDLNKFKDLLKQNKDLLYRPSGLKLFLYYLYIILLYI